MLIDLQKFISEERPFWRELEKVLDKLAKRSELKMTLAQLERFHYLYQRASADLAKIKTFSAEPSTRAYLESMVARAFGEIHETREKTGAQVDPCAAGAVPLSLPTGFRKSGQD